jgi:hypothetical protein
VVVVVVAQEIKLSATQEVLRHLSSLQALPASPLMLMVPQAEMAQLVQEDWAVEFKLQLQLFLGKPYRFM